MSELHFPDDQGEVRRSLDSLHQVRREGGDSSRRTFLKSTAAALTLTGFHAKADAAPSPSAGLRFARRPTPPYHVWFAPRLFDRNIDLYTNMTIDAGGWLDPRIADGVGKTALGWVYGLNHPDADGPEYWSAACSVAGRSYPRKSANTSFVSAGIALDEWVPPKRAENERWLADGLRAGRKANPDVFIAVWSTDPTKLLFDLGKDGTVDLVIVEGYTHSAAAAGPGLVTSWDNAMRRCSALSDAGFEARTIFCFGHISAQANAKGEHLTGSWMNERTRELKRGFPRMPGVAFYQHQAEDSPDFRELLGVCDRLSVEYWP